jgi:hypothetical protein
MQAVVSDVRFGTRMGSVWMRQQIGPAREPPGRAAESLKSIDP